MAKIFKTNANKPEKKLLVRRWQLKWGVALIAALLPTLPITLTAHCYKTEYAVYSDGWLIFRSPNQNACQTYKFMYTDPDSPVGSSTAKSCYGPSGHKFMEYPYEPGYSILATTMSPQLLSDTNGHFNSILITPDHILNSPDAPPVGESGNPPILSNFEWETLKLTRAHRR
jgi:hypothetical protein